MFDKSHVFAKLILTNNSIKYIIYIGLIIIQKFFKIALKISAK